MEYSTTFLWVSMMELSSSTRKGNILSLPQILDCVSLTIGSTTWLSQCPVTTVERSVACVAILMVTKKTTSKCLTSSWQLTETTSESHGKWPFQVWRAAMAARGTPVQSVTHLERLCFQRPLTVVLLQHPQVLFQSAIVHWTHSHTSVTVCMMCVRLMEMKMYCAKA